MSIRNDLSIDWNASPRVITIAAPSTELTIQDLVDTCRFFEDSFPNSCRPRLIDAAGKEFLGGVTYVGITATLQNTLIAFEARSGPSWILCTISGGNVVAIDSVGANMDPRQPTAYITVDRTASASATLQEQSAIQYASFNGGVTVDVVGGEAGTQYPIGTIETPVDNLSDAVSIATTRGFDVLFIKGDITLSGTANLGGVTIVGESTVKSLITIDPASPVTGTEFLNATITGTLDGNNSLHHCSIQTLNYVQGHIDGCLLIEGYTITLGGSDETVILDCWSSGESRSVTPIIDMGSSGRGLVMRGHSGGIKIINKSGPEDITLDFESGEVILDSTITAGDITVRGVGQVVDNSTGTTTVDISGVISQETMAEAVWDESIADHLIVGSTGRSVGITQFNNFVTIDIAGISGTDFPIGTEGTPVNNISDADTIATTMGITEFRFISDFTLDNTVNITNYDLYGLGQDKTTLTFQSGCIVAYCSTYNAKVTGLSLGLTGLYNCLVSNYGGSGLAASDKTIIVEDCIITGAITVPSNYTGALKVVSCYTGGTAAGLDFITIDANGANFRLILKGHSGAIKIINNTHANSYYSLDFESGRLELDSTITAGTFVARGVGLVTDNSSGTSVNVDGVMSKATIAEATWNIELKEYQNDDTPGYALTQLLYADTIFVDSVNGHDGTAYPKGLRNHPVKTVSSVLGLIDTYELSKVHVLGNLTISGGEDIGSLTFLSDRSIGNSVTVTSADTAETYFENLTVSGTMNGVVRFTYCVLGAITGFTGGAKNSLQTDTISLGSANNYLTDLDTYLTSDSYKRINVYGNYLNIIRCQGNYEIANKTGTDCTFINLVGGKIKIDATCTAGCIVINGLGTVTDNSSAGCTVDYSALVAPEIISDQTWDEQKLDHVITGSTGEAFNDLHNEAMCTWKLDPVAKTLTYYRADDTVLKVFNLTSTGTAVPAFIERIA